MLDHIYIVGQKRALCVEWVGGKTPFPRPKKKRLTLADQVAQKPDTVVIVDEDSDVEDDEKIWSWDEAKQKLVCLE